MIKNKIKAIVTIPSPYEVWEGLKGIGTDGWEAIKTIGKFLYYLLHPGLIMQALWHFIDVYSFWICLFLALAAVILYTFGFKKYAKVAPASISVYVLIKMISQVL